jgi:hypothetical protein
MKREKWQPVIRGIVFANERQLARLTAAAAWRGVSRSAAVRELIEAYLVKFERGLAEDTTAA